MHVIIQMMRTTIDITETQRARLLELAARRGEKGFSRIVQEAIDLYLQTHADLTPKIRAAIAVLGTLDEESAAKLRETFTATRESWR